jgi:hypothetical protein
MRLVIRYQKLGSNKVRRGEVTTNNISNLIMLLGSNGYHVIQYYEKTDDDVLLVPMGR